MKVVIKPAQQLLDELQARINFSRASGPSPQWYKILKAIGGKTLDVEVVHLFGDQFNTPGPIHNAAGEVVSQNGARVMNDMIVDVQDDVRPNAGKCDYCWHCTLDVPDTQIGSACGKCSKGKIERIKIIPWK